jgi:hypothetical protein
MHSSVRIETADVPTAYRAWLAAVLAASCAPLWARLASAAIDGGWPREAEYSAADMAAVLDLARKLAAAVGAPAGERLNIDGTVGCPWVTYTTVSETVVTLEGSSVRVSGSAESIVRRILAASAAADVPVTIPADLSHAARVEAGERASRAAMGLLGDAIAEATCRGLRYSAEPADIESTSAPGSW